jgi:hypothetical protein
VLGTKCDVPLPDERLEVSVTFDAERGYIVRRVTPLSPATGRALRQFFSRRRTADVWDHQCGLPNTGLPSPCYGRPTGVLPCRYSFIAFRFLVALLTCRDLLLCAKHLFVAAIGPCTPAQPGRSRFVVMAGAALPLGRGDFPTVGKSPREESMDDPIIRLETLRSSLLLPPPCGCEPAVVWCVGQVMA